MFFEATSYMIKSILKPLFLVLLMFLHITLAGMFEILFNQGTKDIKKLNDRKRCLMSSVLAAILCYIRRPLM